VTRRPFPPVVSTMILKSFKGRRKLKVTSHGHSRDSLSGDLDLYADDQPFLAMMVW
jgi:hypothetical protein